MTFSVDIENHRAATPASTSRFEAMTERLLAFFAEHGISATFFIVGDAARQAPGLVRRIVAAGHEVGSHSDLHVPLQHETPARFGPAMAAMRARLEELAGAPVIGFRAPEFSLVPSTAWAADSLRAAGFVYSSSVVPGRAVSAGFPGAPAGPFLWPSGLLEIPCPVGRLGPFSVPFQGGMYLRYLPPWRYRSLAAQLGQQVNWTYCHPYDIDFDEPLSRLPGRSRLASLLIWANRRVLLRRWEALAQLPDRPFAERLDALRSQAVAFPAT